MRPPVAPGQVRDELERSVLVGDADLSRSADTDRTHGEGDVIVLTGLIAARVTNEAGRSAAMVDAAVAEIDAQLDDADLSWESVRVVTIHLGPLQQGLATWDAIVQNDAVVQNGEPTSGSGPGLADQARTNASRSS